MQENQLLDSMPQNPLPNSTGVLVLGILSIVFCFCYGILGIVFGIIALVLASKDNKLYAHSSTSYTESSYKNMKAGKVCAIIGLSLSGIYVLVIAAYIAFFGAAIGAGILDVLNHLPQQ